MANIRSQIKRNRQNERRRLRNKAVRSELRTRTKVAVAAEPGPRTASRRCAWPCGASTRRPRKGVIHKNQAANRKSRLMRRIARLEAEATASAE